jgi:hypothetical protein
MQPPPHHPQQPGFPVAVIMQWTRLGGRWQSEKWEAVGVMDDPARETEPRLLMQDSVHARWLHPGLNVEMFRDEAEGYYLNLSAPEPFVFVMWRMEGEVARPGFVTLSYNEAARMMDSGESVYGVPMPETWRGWFAEYVQQHYRPEQKKQRARPPSFKGARRDER